MAIENFMLDRLVESNLKAVDKYDDSYVRAIETRIGEYITDTCLPARFQKNRILPEKLVKNSPLYNLRKNIYTLITSDHSSCVFVKDFRVSPYISAMCIERCLELCVNEELHIPRILYIDTNALMEDYATMVSNSKLDVPFQYRLPERVLKSDIYMADCIIWDKFNLSSVQYWLRRMYDILSIRYNRCLNNIFIYGIEDTTVDGSEEFSKLDKELAAVMDVMNFADVRKYEDKLVFEEQLQVL